MLLSAAPITATRSSASSEADSVANKVPPVQTAFQLLVPLCQPMPRFSSPRTFCR